MSINNDPDDVQRGNGRLIFGGAVFGMVFFIGALALLFTFGVPFGGHTDAPQQAAQPGATQQQAAQPQSQPRTH